MDEDFRARLKGQIAVPVDWGITAQGLAPQRVVLYRISGGADYLASGPSGLRTARVQVDCYASGVAAAKILSRSVIAALSGWRSGNILGVFLDAERDLPPETGLAETLGRVSLDFIIHYQE